MGRMPRPWNSIDWDQPRPSLQELVSSWPHLRWEKQALPDEALQPFLDEVRRTHSNGGCLLGRWRAVEYPDVAQWFVSRNRFDEYELFRLLFESETFRGTLPELDVPLTLDRAAAGLKEQWAGSLMLDGAWAGLILQGGAYERFRGTGREAKDLAARAVHAMIGDRFEDFRIDVSYESWTPWFANVAWDRTCVLTDTRNAEITVLCITDTD